MSANRLNTEQLGRAFASSADAPASRSAERRRRIVILVWCTTVALAIGAVIGLSVWQGVQEKKKLRNLDIPLQSAQPDGFISNPSGDLQMIKMNNVLMAGAVASAASLGMCVDASAQSSAVQWTTASGGNGHWYRLLAAEVPLSAEEHFLRAGELGGHTATVTSAAENAFGFAVSQQSGSLNGVFIGVRKQPNNNQGAWVNGENWSYTNWHSGEGGNSWERYAVWTDSWEGQWLDTDLTPQYFSLIEWDADCNGDGIVDYGQILSGQLIDANSNGIPDCCDQGVACVAGSLPVCWRIEDGGNGHWYQVISVVPSETAEQHFGRATALGGHTATFSSAGENSFCFAVSGDTEPFIGVRKQSGNNVGAWITDEPWQYSNWHGGEGNNSWERYVRLNALWSGQWQDTDLTPGRYSVVEWESDCNADGIVDHGQILSGQLIDANANGVPDVCELGPCPGDISGNNAVDGVDLSVLLGVWGTDGSGGEFDADVTNDGIVNGADLTIILGGWGPCPN